MSLNGRLGGAVMKRIEALPSVRAEIQRAARTAPSEASARKLAYTRLNDEAAKAKLCEQLDATPEVLTETAIAMSKRRADYINDRSYRLLSAAAADRAVQPIPPERAELFGREEALGHMPIEEAFALLIESEPRLADMQQCALTHSPVPDVGCQLAEDIRRSLHLLVGGGAEAEDELLHTALATSIAHQYLQMLGDEECRASTQTPYWEIPRRKVVLTSTLGPRQRKPATGRA